MQIFVETNKLYEYIWWNNKKISINFKQIGLKNGYHFDTKISLKNQFFPIKKSV